jgi:hypothetical protein
MAETLADDQVRPGHGRLGVADGAAGHDCGVVGPALVQPRGRRERGFGRGQRWQRRVLNGDRVERVSELREALRDHDGDRLADVAHHVPGQDGLGPNATLLSAAVGGRHVGGNLAAIGGAPGGDDAGQATGSVDGHGDDSRMGVGAADDAQVQEPVTSEVVEEAAATRQEPLVPLAQRRGTDHLEGESITPVEVPLG